MSFPSFVCSFALHSIQILKVVLFNYSVKTVLDPSRDQDCRIDVSIALWIVEAKGLTNKKRYFSNPLLQKYKQHLVRMIS